MDRNTSDIDRRAYLKYTGAVAVAGLTGLAGCTGDGGSGDGGSDGDGGSGGYGGSGSGGGSEPTTVIPGTAPGFPPFEMKNDQGELVGFDIDLLSAVVAEADGYELGEWKTFEFSSLIPALQNDRIDVIAAAMTITKKRDGTIDFTNPYYSADQAVLVREGGDFSPASLDDLAGHVIGAQEGTTGAGLVQEQLVTPGKVKESNFKKYGSYVLAVEDLVNGNLDAIVVDKPVAETFAAQRDVQVAFVYETGEHYGFGVRTDADDLTKALNEGLAAVRDSGQYEEIRNEWFSDA